VTGSRIAFAWTLAFGVVAASGEAMAVEKLRYETIEQDGPFELRRLAPHVVAETFVDGGFEDVGNEGFRRLVAYIGGENRQRDEISMTAPVAQEPATRIAMTAPVGQERSGDRYRITFVMPSRYTLESLPEPTDERITLRPDARATRTTSASCRPGWNAGASSRWASPCGLATTPLSCPGSCAATRSSSR
jgi:hypothetical protein